jgi:hypothetical protein
VRRLFTDGSHKDILYPLLVIFIGTFGATSLTRPNDRLSYAAFLVLCGGFVVRMAKEWSVTRPRLVLQAYDVVPLALLGVWLYGVLLGFSRGNSARNVIANFAGMTIYAIYYFFLFCRIRKFDLLRCVVAAAAVNVGYMFMFFIWDKVFGYFVARSQFHRFFFVRDYYSETLILVAVPVVLILGGLLSGRPRTVGWRPRATIIAVFFIHAYALVQMSLSKAILLFYFLSIAFLVLYFRRNILALLRRRDVMPTVVLVGALALAIYPSIHATGTYVATAIFNVTGRQMLQPEEAALARTAALARSEQTKELLGDLHFWGRGLGAPISSGYSRDAAGYGFEQNYLNLIHKFGVFAGVIFLAYLFLAWRIFTGLRTFTTRPLAFASMAVFAGFIMGYGNPMLMSPVMVAFQCVILFWLRPGPSIQGASMTALANA